MCKLISLVVPAHNEEKNVTELFKRVDALFAVLPYNYELLFVNDGSTDATQVELEKLSFSSSNVFYIQLSRNFGHQAALKAGLDNANGSAIISMDADLQHPIDVVPKMLKAWESGFDVVTTQRDYTEGVGFVKKKTSKLFYKILSNISEINLLPGAADYRLMDAKVTRVFTGFSENQLFIRGLIHWLGYNQTTIHYAAEARLHGSSSYSAKKMIKFAVDGITSFSSKPLWVAIYLGFFFAGSSLLFVPYILWSYLAGVTVPGWSSVLLTVVFFGGMQLIILGILGTYIGKIFSEVKQRPQYIIKDTNLE